MLKNVAQLVHSRHRSVHNFIMNLLAAMGAYCFFATKPGVNFDYDVSESSGQLVFGGKHDGKKSGDPTGSPDNLCLFSEQPLGLSLSRTRVLR